MEPDGALFVRCPPRGGNALGAARRALRVCMQRSLKSRALQLLAQRDQSRLELRRKLLRHARGARSAIPRCRRRRRRAIAAEVDALLDWLEANRFLSDARFAESRVHARAQRFGVQRIRSELAQHGVELSPELAASLAASEIDRAAAVRARRFAALPAIARQSERRSRASCSGAASRPSSCSA